MKTHFVKKTLLKTSVASTLFSSSIPLFTLLSPQAIAQEQLDEIIVTSSRIEMPVRQIGTAVTVLTDNDIQLKGYASINDVLRTQAGISSTSNGGPGKATTLRIRGEDGNRTLVLIDGVDISDPTATQIGPQIQYLSNSPEISRIEILRGPQGFLYGADAGGVVNIFTRTLDDGFSGSVSAESGRYDTNNLNAFVGGGNKYFDTLVSISDQSTDGFNAQTADPANEPDAYDNQTIHAKLGVKPTSNSRIQLVLRDVQAESEYDNCFGLDPNDCLSKSDQTLGKLSGEIALSNTSHSLAFSKTDIERENISNGSSSFATDGGMEKVEYVGSIDFNSAFSLVGGADYQDEKVNPSSGETLTQDQLGIFTELQFDLIDSLYLNIGTRWDDNEHFGKHFSHRLSAAYVMELGQSEHSLKIRSSYGTGFRAPSPSEIAYNNGPFAFGDAAATKLTEETSSGWDAGADLYLATGGVISLTYFDQNIDDQIYFDLIDFSGYLQYQGTTYSHGVELSGDIPIAHFVEFTGNATYNDTEGTDGRARARVPRKIANIGFKFHFLDDSLNILTNYRIARDAYNDIFGSGRVELDNYEVWDISANYTFVGSLEIFGRIENITDEEYQEITGFNASGRAGYAGFRYNF